MSAQEMKSIDEKSRQFEIDYHKQQHEEKRQAKQQAGFKKKWEARKKSAPKASVPQTQPPPPIILRPSQKPRAIRFAAPPPPTQSPNAGRISAHQDKKPKTEYPTNIESQRLPPQPPCQVQHQQDQPLSTNQSEPHALGNDFNDPEREFGYEPIFSPPLIHSASQETNFMASIFFNPRSIGSSKSEIQTKSAFSESIVSSFYPGYFIFCPHITTVRFRVGFLKAYPTKEHVRHGALT